MTASLDWRSVPFAFDLVLTESITCTKRIAFETKIKGNGDGVESWIGAIEALDGEPADTKTTTATCSLVTGSISRQLLPNSHEGLGVYSRFLNWIHTLSWGTVSERQLCIGDWKRGVDGSPLRRSYRLICKKREAQEQCDDGDKLNLYVINDPLIHRLPATFADRVKRSMTPTLSDDRIFPAKLSLCFQGVRMG
jgi:hypothetical protein